MSGEREASDQAHLQTLTFLTVYQMALCYASCHESQSLIVSNVNFDDDDDDDLFPLSGACALLRR